MSVLQTPGIRPLCLAPGNQRQRVADGGTIIDAVETDKIIYEVLQEEFKWLKQLQSIPEAWMRVIFASDSYSSLSPDTHEYECAIGKVMDALSRSGYR